MKEIELYPSQQIIGINLHSSLSLRQRIESLTALPKEKQ